MTQNPSHICPNCGSAVAAGQSFCSNCGAIQDIGGNKPTALTPSSGGQAPDMMTQRSVPPPPPPTTYGATPAAPFEQGYQQQAQGYMPPPSYQPVPEYAKPVKDSSGSVVRQLGCGVGVVILVIVLACGGLGYFVYNSLHNAANNLKPTSNTSSATTSNSSSSVSGNQPTTQSAIATTATINATVTYASVNITVVDVKQATTFTDDSSASPNGMVRLDIKEQTPAGKTGRYLYSDIARLQLPDGTIVQPLNVHDGISPDSGVVRNNWVDFPVPATIKAAQLTLLLGSDAETQIKIPLNGKADLTAYQDKTSTPNKQTTYNGLKWTITNATLSLSSSGTQAPKGMAFVTVTLKVDNPTSTTFRGYYGDYIRLKAGDTTSAPTGDSTLPLGFDAGSSGQTGTVVFQVPQNVTAYTLTLLGNSSLNISQASIDFQI